MIGHTYDQLCHSFVQEELKRTGVPEGMPSNFEKPLPQDVLKTLSYGIDFEKIMEVNDDEESEPPLTPTSIKCSKDCRNSVEYGLDNFEGCSNLSSKYLEKNDNIGSSPFLDSLSEAVYEDKTSASDTIDKLRISCSVGQFSEKVNALILMVSLPNSTPTKSQQGQKNIAGDLESLYVCESEVEMEGGKCYQV